MIRMRVLWGPYKFTTQCSDRPLEKVASDMECPVDDDFLRLLLIDPGLASKRFSLGFRVLGLRG